MLQVAGQFVTYSVNDISLTNKKKQVTSISRDIQLHERFEGN